MSKEKKTIHVITEEDVITEENDLICPVCNNGKMTKKLWRESCQNPSIRALWAPPFARRENAWIYSNFKDQPAKREHAIVESASFGKCGYQDIEIGLTLTLKIEDHGMVCWTFYNYGDIAEFFSRAKANNVSALRGTPVVVLMSGSGGPGSSILGIDVIDSLVLEH